MDLLLTVVRPGPGPEVREDALVSVGEGATVADLARALDERAGAGAQQRPHPSLPHAPGAGSLSISGPVERVVLTGAVG